MNEERIRVLVTDDHPVVLFGLAAIISAQSDMVVVARAASGQEAVELFREHRPDITLMDLRLPGMSGVEAIRVLRREYPDSRFIVLTTYEGDENIHRAVQAGAQAYLLKGMPHAELVKAIRAVHRGLRYLPTPVRESLEGRPHGPVLSDREMEILQLIVRGLSNKEIGRVLHITEGTVKWHVNIILSRLNVNDRTQAVVAAVRRGLVHL
ncbi:MAG: response regulator transcription factor [Acidobacteria bacterium]|nr:response regulator transcription factor [Acidobacteriota bacterium]